MLTIRFTRKGRKNQPFYRVVVVDKKRSSKGGRSVEIVGHVDPLTKKKALKKDRILHWIKMGAQPSDTVHNLLVSEKIIDAKKKHVARVKKSAEAAAAAPAAVPTPASVSGETKSAEATAGKPAAAEAPVPAAPVEPVKPEEPPTAAEAAADKKA